MNARNSSTLANPPSKNRVNKSNHRTPAAKWNLQKMRSVEAALKKDSEADITVLLGDSYSKKLRSHKMLAPRLSTDSQPPKPSQRHPSDIRSRLDSSEPSTVIFELSTETKNLFSQQQDLSKAMVDLLAGSRLLYEGAWSASVMIFKVSDDMVVKATHDEYAPTEHWSLSYLQEHLPPFPVPRPHGLVRFSGFHFLFMTFVPGLSLEVAWSQLDHVQKGAISSQLNSLFSELRSLPFPVGGSLGDGEVCKDGRRFVRASSQPIMNVKQFEDWLFTGSDTASPLYTRLLRDWTSPSPSVECVFTHGDVRPGNIMVTVEDGMWRVVAIIDWESSGFYPEYWESVKMTNNLTSKDDLDWYKYLPESISPRQYPVHWLLDRVWGCSMSNN